VSQEAPVLADGRQTKNVRVPGTALPQTDTTLADDDPGGTTTARTRMLVTRQGNRCR
jgi:hypothetical protein